MTQRDLIDALRTGICVTDRDGLITHCNPAFEALLGHGRGELVGRRIQELTPSGTGRETLGRGLDELAGDGPSPAPARMTCTRKDGTLVDLHVDWTCHRDSNGVPKGFLAEFFAPATRDSRGPAIDQRAAGRSILLEVGASLAETLELGRVLQAAVDGVTGLIGLDTAAVYLLEGEMLRLGATTPPLPPDFPEQLRLARLDDHPHIRKSLSAREPLLIADYPTLELTPAERAVTEQRQLRTVLFLPIEADARMLGVFIVGSVGTPTRLSEAELELSRALASLAALAVRNAQLFMERESYAERLQQSLAYREQAERERATLLAQLAHAQRVESIGRLAGGVAHDLNNLLVPILAYGELLLVDLGPGDPHREMVEQILRAGTRARDLIGQLLAFGRKQTLRFEPTCLDHAVIALEKLLRRTIPEDIDIDINSGVADRTVMADIGQIERVIVNLALNAADAMPQGGRLMIRTSAVTLDEQHAAEREVAPGDYVVLAIADTGTGMDDETREHLFEPFFTTKGERGTGLGLATIYGIVKQHGGSVLVETALGQGTTFEVCLPVWEGTTVETARSSERAPEPVHVTGCTVLLVEDDDQVRLLAQTLLRRLGYHVLEASCGEEALRVMESHRGSVDLLLTDVVMPGLNGKDLFAQAVKLQPALKVIYMSGYATDVTTHRGVLEEDGDYLPKPFTVSAFNAKVSEVLTPESQRPPSTL
jgi:PAS domain S-box-containing protein